ncbi:transmembrane protein 69 [Ambystoma mexicanum]|uniref:transmembrane protein 69 n=1 Tax=Ambystoma mexicanum TaxID=8296 RepID=UPI0037E739E1
MVLATLDENFYSLQVEMLHFLRRSCFQSAIEMQRFPFRLLHGCVQTRTPARSCLQGLLFQRLYPSLARSIQPSMTSVIQSRKLHISPHCFKKRKPAEPEPRELDLLRYDMKSLKHSPKPALYLGLAGLVPFISLPLIMGMTEVYYPELAFAQLAYGASILSFLGGARWGFAIPEGSPAKPDWINLANSTVPALLAWAALLLRDNLTGATILLIMGFGIALHYDLSLLPTYPAWFKALRSILTLVAVFSLICTLFARTAYPEKALLSK